MSSSAITQLTQKSLVKWLIVVVLAAFTAIAVLPNYWSGGWPWTQPPGVAQLDKIKTLRTEGLNRSDWTVDFEEATRIGGKQWFLQQFTAPTLGDTPQNLSQQFLTIIRSQSQSEDQPEVEWIDLKGAQQWTTDSYEKVKLVATDADGKTFKATANFFRAWNQQQTFAALQWYAWPRGGHPSPSHWFWGDQTYQWRHRQRLPWVAVNVLVPIEPLGDASTQQETAIQIGQEIQSILQTDIFAQ